MSARGCGRTAHATTCVTVTLSSSCTGANDIFAAAYLNSFDPANLGTNYLGDGGNSPSLVGVRASNGVAVP